MSLELQGKKKSEFSPNFENFLRITSLYLAILRLYLKIMT